MGQEMGVANPQHIQFSSCLSFRISIIQLNLFTTSAR